MLYISTRRLTILVLVAVALVHHTLLFSRALYDLDLGIYSLLSLLIFYDASLAGLGLLALRSLPDSSLGVAHSRLLGSMGRHTTSSCLSSIFAATLGTRSLYWL